MLAVKTVGGAMKAVVVVIVVVVMVVMKTKVERKEGGAHQGALVGGVEERREGVALGVGLGAQGQRQGKGAGGWKCGVRSLEACKGTHIHKIHSGGERMLNTHICTRTHMHAHTYTCAANRVECVCVCVCLCVCVCCVQEKKGGVKYADGSVWVEYAGEQT